MKNNKSDFIRSKHTEKNIYVKKDGKKKVSFYIVVCLIVFWTVCGFLTIFNTAKGCDNVAKADEVVSSDVFLGSNLSLNAVIVDKVNLLSTDVNNQISFRVSLSYNADNQLVMNTYFVSAYRHFYLSPLARNGPSDSGFSIDTENRQVIIGSTGHFAGHGLPFADWNDLYKIYFSYDFNDSEISAAIPMTNPLYNTFYYNFLMTLAIFKDTEFTNNIVKVELGSWNQAELEPTGIGQGFSANYIRYIDNNDNSLYLVVPIITSWDYMPAFLWQHRTYYLINDFSNNEYYQEGYNVGLGNGIEVGQREGYKNGYSAGDSAGYNRGYNAGVEASNQYTFLGLLGAVVDAPLRMLTDMLNFDILGLNMSNFVTGILTVALIIFVVRKIL